jgi:LysR family transcriptional activator of nhaA
MNWLNYHHLFYFYTIAREGGVAKAARRLSLGQPTLSTQLKRFEENVGTPLFRRSARSLQLTETGQMVFEYAKDIFALGQELSEAIKDQNFKTKRVHFQIGALDSVPKALLNSLIQDAYQEDCFVSVLEGTGEFLLRELRAHRLDLVISNSPAPLAPQSEFRSRMVAELPVIIAGSSSFQKLKKGFPSSLSEQPLVLPTFHSKLRQDIDAFFEQHQIRVRAIGETQDTEVMKNLARAGKALIAVARPAVAAELESDLCEIGELKGVREQIWLTSASRKKENPISGRLFRSFSISA